MLAALRSGDWAMSRQLAAGDPDPVALELVAFLQILNAPPGSSRLGAGDILAFNAGHGDWPDQPALARRLADAVVDASDLRVVLKVCAARPQALPEAASRCADALGWAGESAKAAASARDAWRGGLAGQGAEQDFLARWSASVTPDDQWARFEKLVPAGGDAVQRQIARLGPQARAAALAVMAFRHDDPAGLAMLSEVPQGLRSLPVLLLEQARWLRRSASDEAAVALWQGAAEQAELTLPVAARPAYWTERDILARRLLTDGDAANALLIADDQSLTPDQAADALFLAGWILLRRLHDPARASARFATLARSSHSVITSARAHYWLGRAAGDAGAEEYGRAAAFPVAFYGQLAALRLHRDAAGLAPLRDPAWSAADALDVSGGKLGKAALKLVEWGDRRRAKSFVLRIGQLEQAPKGFAVDAGLAHRLGFDDSAVQIARLAGRAGVMLPVVGWPDPPASLDPANLLASDAAASDVDPALVLGLIRQESSFDPDATSPAGARGLMQLMPRTARQMRDALGGDDADDADRATPDLADPAVNMRLGTHYLATLLQQFGGVVPYAVAAYNAGPRRAHDWIAANGDANAGSGSGSNAGDVSEAMIDWIEMIPFAETRNYVQRVMENAVLYRARRSTSR